MTSSAMKKHERFLLDELLPLIANHAERAGCDMTEAAFAVFLSMGTILHSQGFTADSLLLAIRASAVTTHDAPEGLQ